MIVLREASGTVNIGALGIRESGGVTEIGEVYIRDASGLKELFSPSEGGGGAFTVDVPPNVYGYGNSLSSIAITTGIATATPIGGTSPFSYAWAGGDENWTITNPASASTAFRAAAVPAADGFTTTFTCTVTDANGQVVESSEVSAEAYNFGGYD